MLISHEKGFVHRKCNNLVYKFNTRYVMNTCQQITYLRKFGKHPRRHTIIVLLLEFYFAAPFNLLIIW